MKRYVAITGAALLMSVGMFAGSARAENEMAAGEHARGALGFHNSSAPIGGRWWLSGEKVGIDAGIGFSSSPAPNHPKEKVSSFSLDVGVPFVLKSWSRAHLILRPGLTYGSQKFETSSSVQPFDTDNQTTMTVSGEFEAEVFLVDNVSVSASHGIRYESVNPPGSGDNSTSFSTFGNNFTEVGFHIYFLGGSK